MALSGTYTAAVNSWIRTELRWTAKQNESKNESTISASLYLISRANAAVIYSSVSRSVSITIDGVRSPAATATVALSGGQTKLLRSWSRTISHNSDGKKSFAISGTQDFGGVSITGVKKYNITASGTGVLNSIARESTMSTSRNWTAGNNLTVGLSRASNAFNHWVYIDVQQSNGSWTNIKRLDYNTSTTSQSSGFNAGEHKAIFAAINGRASAPVRMNLRTRNGSTTVGTTTYTGTVTAPAASTTSFGGNFEIGDTIGGSITRANSLMRHTIQLIFGGSTYTLHTKITATTWNYNTSAISAALLGKIPNASSIVGQIRILTYYSDGAQVRTHNQSNLTASVDRSGSAPTFHVAQFGYDDNNSATVAITGDNQTIIQRQSTLRARLISLATPQNGATIRSYEFTADGLSATRTGVGYSELGKVPSGKGVTLSVKVTDSRGLSTTVSKDVTILPYHAPIVSPRADRRDGFERDTTISITGSLALLRVGNENKNKLLGVYYHYRERAGGSYSAITEIPITYQLPSFTGASTVVELNNQKAWDVRFYVTDQLSSTVIDVVVSVGQPILFIDADKNSIGFNDYPVNPDEFLVNGRMAFGANQYASNSPGEGGGGLFMNNSDITGANGIYFNDVSNNNGEGLLWLKTGSPTASTSHADYDNFRILDGEAQLAGVPVFSSKTENIWFGVYFMTATHKVTPRKKLTDCPHGWVLVWSSYSGGSANDHNYSFDYIPKEEADISSGGKGFIIRDGTSGHCNKYLYITNTTISGHDSNSEGNNSNRVLRRVLAF